MTGAKNLDVPHVGGAVEGALVSHLGRALVSEHVLRVELAAVGALGQAAIRHGGALCPGVLRLSAREVLVYNGWQGEAQQHHPLLCSRVLGGVRNGSS